jgi:SAM-dependent methyltransferase
MASVCAVERTLELFEPARRPTRPDVGHGYLDLLGDDDPTGRRPGQRLMVSRVLPLIYERVWRPVGGPLLMGALGPSMADERRIALDMLDISPAATVLDVACGPGHFTRAFAGAALDGLVVGLDASRTMLAQAARAQPAAQIAYVRGTRRPCPSATGPSTRSAASPRCT